MSSGGDRSQIGPALALTSLVSQIGCVTLVIVFGALLAGLGLDKLLGTRPLFTVLLLVGSVPVSMFLVVRIALSAAAQLNQPPPTKTEDASVEKEGAPREDKL